MGINLTINLFRKLVTLVIIVILFGIAFFLLFDFREDVPINTETTVSDKLIELQDHVDELITSDLYAFEEVELNGNKYSVVKVDPSEIDFFWKNDLGEKFVTVSRLKSYVEGQGNELVFATNAGMFNDDNSPIGLYIEESEKIKEINMNEGPGNFHLMPNGVFAVYEDRAEVVTSAAYEDDSGIKHATQSGPMLVIDDEIHPNLTEGSKNLHIRNGVGVDTDGNVIFVISNNMVNFYDFASLFKDQYSCPNALYLDGVVSTMYVPGERGLDAFGDLGVIIGVVE